MGTKWKRRLLVGAVGVASVAVGLRFVIGRAHAPAQTSRLSNEWQAPLRSYPSASHDAGARSAETADERAKEVRATIDAWRGAILQKDADTVVRLDFGFRDAPDRYRPALLESARSDPNERVRAFSTRELGKLASADLAPQFGRLLGDSSPYVRQNAAWALGELGNLPGGRAAAHVVLADLKRVEARDPAKDVRSAARSALGKLE